MAAEVEDQPKGEEEGAEEMEADQAAVEECNPRCNPAQARQSTWSSAIGEGLKGGSMKV